MKPAKESKKNKIRKGWICPYCKKEHLNVSPFCEKYPMEAK